MAGNGIPQVTVRSQFQRSVRLDSDFDLPDALAGYILQPSPRQALETVARHICQTKQRAFTWTGPYGGGKSSLALATAVLAGGHTDGRRVARKVLGVQQGGLVDQAFGTRKPWLVLPAVGRRESVEAVIAAALDQYAPTRGRKPVRDGKRDVITELVRQADSNEHGGVLLILDELGKLLESAASTGDDIFFYQELAEAASRCKGRLVIIGVLHQAFEQYAARSGRDVREEWAKVQGRYVDIPVVAGSDEVIDLIGRAVETKAEHPKTLRVAKHIAASMRKRRPSTPADLDQALDKCWPLHPVTAALLGPSSRRKFGQNERSVFGFLTSAEPMGFRDFLRNRTGEEPDGYYTPAKYWDYLRANLESAILSSPDGHRWAIGAEAVERVEARFDEPHISLVKTVGLIELFRAGSGLSADLELLNECVPGTTHKQIETALQDLARASILIYRKHLQAWALFAGSDFDIDAAVADARQTMGPVDASVFKTLTAMPAVPARRHYVTTGTLRWFEREVVPLSEAKRQPADLRTGARTGRFVLVLPSADVTDKQAMGIAAGLSKFEDGSDIAVYGVPLRQADFMEQVAELAALEHVSRNKPELEGDSVARREIDGRLRQLRGDLSTQVNEAFASARWYLDGERQTTHAGEGLSPLASELCEKAFPLAPVIHSELVNRDVPSSNAAKAQRLLLHRMVEYGSRPKLEYDGYPADAGLYYTVVASLGIHRKQGDAWAFQSPEKAKAGNSGSLLPLWFATESLLENARGPVTLADIYALWKARPYGVKEGVMPILALAFFLANRSRIALYAEGMFVPNLTPASVDEWLQDPKRITWKLVQIDAAAKRFLTKLAARLEQAVKREVAADPLDSARALVAIALALPGWTQKTNRVSERARTVRQTLLKASDPVKVLFTDLPELLGTHEAERLVSDIGEIIQELDEAYPEVLALLEKRMLDAIDHDHRVGWEPLHERARLVQGVSGDFKLDAFAARLSVYTGRLEDIEALVSIAVSKPITALTDHDIDQANLQLAKWAFEFRRVEALSVVEGRASKRQALAVVFGAGETLSATFDVSDSDRNAVQEMSKRLMDRFVPGKVKPDVFLAALVDAGMKMLAQREEEKF
ncbi:hypothetical protein [Dyella sp. GSA-30]|uniref:hypothetical protein n=1 Tax=Dyella sp. GSA-30 TaxID=2994496 RepID=UPI002491C615|nr:hypothetical protein [Dyella sp. GSA-30]BDU22921.1 hypothetical protein DYGSA30_43780 [Dyella sp. GSA-30]